MIVAGCGWDMNCIFAFCVQNYSKCLNLFVFFRRVFLFLLVIFFFFFSVIIKTLIFVSLLPIVCFFHINYQVLSLDISNGFFGSHMRIDNDFCFCFSGNFHLNA